MVSSLDGLGGDGKNDVVADGETSTQILFMGAFEHGNVLGDTWVIGIVALYLGWKVCGVDGVDASAIVQYMGEDMMGGGIHVECLHILQILVPGVIHRFAHELVRAAFCRFVDVVVGDAGVVLLLHSRMDNRLGIIGDRGVVYG